MSTVRYLLNDAVAECDPDTDTLLTKSGLWVDVAAGGTQQAEKPGGNPVIPDPVVAKPPVVDASPPVLTVGEVTPTSVHLSWTDKGAGVSYLVEKTRFASGMAPQIVYKGTATVVDKNLGPGIWDVTVTADGAAFPGGHTAASDPVKVTVAAPVAPAPPTPKPSAKKTGA